MRSHTSPRPAYDEDLAYVHHVGFGGLATAAAPGVVDRLSRAGIHRGRVLDVGCGSGLLARGLQRAGYSVVGIDTSPAMIALARRVAPTARFLCDSVYTCTLPPCEAAVALGETFNYLPPSGRAPSMAAVFARLARALGPDGLLLFDVLVEGEPRGQMEYRGWHAGADWATLVDVREDRRRVRREITIFRRVGRTFRRSREVHVVRVFSRRDLERTLARAGFEVRVSGGYGDFAVAERRLVFEARLSRTAAPELPWVPDVGSRSRGRSVALQRSMIVPARPSTASSSWSGHVTTARRPPASR